MIKIYPFDNLSVMAERLAAIVGQQLRNELEAAGARPLLSLSGGTTPQPFLNNLAKEQLEWQRVDVTLVDDRWVPDTDPASNAGLVRKCLLHGAAEQARFFPLVDMSTTLEARVAALNDNTTLVTPSIAVLGMGEDGHVASLFADAPEWPYIVDDGAPRFVAVHPRSAPHDRVSLSLTEIRQAWHLYLVIAGARKREVLKAAAASPQDNAISKLVHHEYVKLNVYWSAN